MEIRKEIAGVLKYFSDEALTTDEAIDSILRLFSVIGSAAKHDRHYFKCDVCGKFIGYAEFERDEIKTEYRPETVYEWEKITHVHKH